MVAKCSASVTRPWYIPFFFITIGVGVACFAKLLAPTNVGSLLGGLPSWATVAINFASFIAIFVAAIIFFGRLSKAQDITLDSSGLDFELSGRINLEDIVSYDTNVNNYTNRLYLTIRPRGRMSLRILSGPRQEFVDFCRAFEHQVASKAQSVEGVVNTATQKSFNTSLLRGLYLGKTDREATSGVPVKRSFYGSPLARTIGVLGLLALGGGVVGALLIDPALVMYAVLLAVAGGAPMLILALGGRAE